MVVQEHRIVVPGSIEKAWVGARVERGLVWKMPMRVLSLGVLGRVPEWSNGADCKSVVRGFESHPDLSPECLRRAAASKPGPAGSAAPLSIS